MGVAWRRLCAVANARVPAHGSYCGNVCNRVTLLLQHSPRRSAGSASAVDERAWQDYAKDFTEV